LNDAAEVGLLPDQFWSMTPVEFYHYRIGVNKRKKAEFEVQERLNRMILHSIRLQTQALWNIQVKPSDRKRADQFWPLPGDEEKPVSRSTFTSDQAKRIVENYKKVGIIH